MNAIWTDASTIMLSSVRQPSVRYDTVYDNPVTNQKVESNQLEVVLAVATLVYVHNALERCARGHRTPPLLSILLRASHGSLFCESATRGCATRLLQCAAQSRFKTPAAVVTQRRTSALDAPEKGGSLQCALHRPVQTLPKLLDSTDARAFDHEGVQCL